MLSRRNFVACAGSTVMVPSEWILGAALPSSRACIRAAVALSDADCRDFHRAVARDGRHVCIDDGAYLQHVTAILDEGASEALVGLTRDSDFVILQHLAAERGLRRTYLGRHLYRHDGLNHVLSAEARILTPLLRRLSMGAPDWGRALGDLVPLIASSRREEQTRVALTRQARPAASPGYLVSWAFRKED